MSKLLLNSQPLVVIPELATLIGLNESIVIQQLHYWLEINRQANKNFIQEKYWTYNSMDEWQKQFPFWSPKTLQRTFTSLKNLNLLYIENFNKNKFDKTNWYSINYEQLDKLQNQEETEDLIVEKSSENATKNPVTLDMTDRVKMTSSRGSNWPHRESQNGLMDTVILTQPIPEINTEIKIINQSIKEDSNYIQKNNQKQGKEIDTIDKTFRSENFEQKKKPFSPDTEKTATQKNIAKAIIAKQINYDNTRSLSDSVKLLWVFKKQSTPKTVISIKLPLLM